MLIILSIAVGVFAIGLMGMSQLALLESLDAQYAAMRPADAILLTEPRLDEDFVEGIRNMQGVEDAEGRRYLFLRISLDGRGETWRDLTLYALHDYEDQRLFLVRQQEPLSADVVLREIATLCRLYRISRVWTDQWALDAMRPMAAAFGLTLSESRERDSWTLYDSLRLAIATQKMERPPVEQMRLDLIRIVKRPTATGMKITLPTTSDGRHCDFVPPLAILLAHPPPVSVEEAALPDSDEDRLERELATTAEDGLEAMGIRL